VIDRKMTDKEARAGFGYLLRKFKVLKEEMVRISQAISEY